jgi:hypothetical protein
MCHIRNAKNLLIQVSPQPPSPAGGNIVNHGGFIATNKMRNFSLSDDINKMEPLLQILKFQH